jgi:CubicO group peptidase (beta-lactamase class C family)
VGWITSELVRRITGMTIGQWLHERVAERLGLSLYFGLPRAERGRVARVQYRDGALVDTMLEALRGTDSWRALTMNGAISFARDLGERSLNDHEVLSLELAGAALVADARSLAAFYAACLAPIDGLRLLSDAVIVEAVKPVSTGAQFETPVPGPSWGAGVMIPWSVQPMLGGSSFGHDGMGGSLAFACPERELSFAYVRNSMATGGVKDPEVYAVVDALRDIVDGVA